MLNEKFMIGNLVTRTRKRLMKERMLTARQLLEIISGQPFLFLSYTINLLTVRSGVESGTTINPGNEIFITLVKIS